MSKALNVIAAIVMLGVATMGSAGAREMQGYHAIPYYVSPPPGEYQLQHPIKPQFNNPGPQISVPKPVNPVELLPPLFGAGQPDALGLK